MPIASQTAIPCLLMRGGTSKGPLFNAADLPQDLAIRDRVLLAALGSPDARQIDGIGGAHPLTSKVGIVSLSQEAGVDLDFLFAQIQPDKDTVDTTPNCGNMLAAVLPFALETGMVQPQADSTTLRVLTRNTGMQCDITVDTRGGVVQYEGSARMDGAPGTSAPVTINFLDTAGSVCDGLLPTGRVKDRVTVNAPGLQPFTLNVTCIDNGMPLVIFRADDLGCTGYESVTELNADVALKARIEALRLQVSVLMGLGVLAAVTVGTACVMPGSVCEGVAEMSEHGLEQTVSVEHPTGEFSVALGLDPAKPHNVTRAALLRTARLLMRGEVFVPASVWDGIQ